MPIHPANGVVECVEAVVRHTIHCRPRVKQEHDRLSKANFSSVHQRCLPSSICVVNAAARGEQGSHLIHISYSCCMMQW